MQSSCVSLSLAVYGLRRRFFYYMQEKKGVHFVMHAPFESLCNVIVVLFCVVVECGHAVELYLFKQFVGRSASFCRKSSGRNLVLVHKYFLYGFGACFQTVSG